MLATPALAVDVDIWAEAGDDANKVEIWYDVYNPVPGCPDGGRPRAFGLSIKVTDGNIVDINVPFEGECDVNNQGYGIFPGTIDIDEAGDVSDYGTPVAPSDAPGAIGTGIDTNTIVIEMGSLYTGVNCPDPCALLFTIEVSLDCNVSIAGDPARTGTASPEGKGVVLENLAEVLVHFPTEPFKVKGISRWVPDVEGLIQAEAEAAIDACDLDVGDVTWECNETVAFDYVLSQSPEAGKEVRKGTEVDLVKSLGPCDFGDANDPPYPTLWANNGAVHVATGVILGVFRDTEPDGQPSPNADLDDNTGAPDDEDGITQLLITPLGGFVTINVTQSCYLNAWVDFNDNGDWDDAGEQIFTDELLVIVGANPRLFAVPAGARREIPLISRWRVNDAGGLDYTGLADDGEVEDYNTGIVCHVPDVVNEPNLAARAEIIANGFTIGDVTAECNDVIPGGNVISTDPNYCHTPDCNSPVDIVVSTGPCEEPDPNADTCWDNVNECAAQYAPDALTAQATGLGGDSDCTGDVDFGDLAAMMRSWGKTKGVDPESCDPVTGAGKYCCCTDFNHDGAVDFGDLAILMATWGNTGASPATLNQNCP